jgi:hypothetical protein
MRVNVLASIRSLALAAVLAVPVALSGGPGAALAAGSTGRLERVPVVGTAGDLRLAPPSERGWQEANGVSGLEKVGRLDLLPGEYALGRWRVLNNPNGPYVYFYATAINLDQHPEVKSAADLAAAKLTQLCRYSDGCQLTEPQGVSASGQDQPSGEATVGGESTAVRISTDTRKFRVSPGSGDLENLSVTGIASEAPPENTYDHVDWTSHHVFLVHGNWGYELRLTSIDPNVLQSRMGDFDKTLSGLSFAY